MLASVDPVNRELRHFFAETMQPPTREPGDISRWLAAFVASVTKDQRNALVISVAAIRRYLAWSPRRPISWNASRRLASRWWRSMWYHPDRST